jgi:FKBP-type peptidyl-prolyl cis-trans isomerase FkpA/FKBP-type peptidyl-prolyl cis-trans isomerase FklB
MKKFVVFACLFGVALSLHARAIQEDYRVAEEKARVSYAFGMLIGSNLGTASLDFDYTAFAEGMKAMIEDGRGQFSEQEAMEIVETALQNVMERILAESRTREHEFLTGNMERPEVTVTASGLQYTILEETTGEKPQPDSVVRVHYVGTFIDGSPFDRSDAEGTYIPLEMVIRGWTEGLVLMSVGSKYRFYIPSYLAYGSEGINQIIPPYSTLIFTVELLEIISEDAFNYY